MKLRNVGGNLDIFVAGVGTGGTLSGVGEFLKEKNPAIKVVALEPDSSPVLSEGVASPHKICATSIDADFLATGHYARVVFEEGRFKLKQATDTKKDQSYVLYNLTAEKLARILLPLGDFSKAQTRRLAAQMNLPVAFKPDRTR